MLDCRFTIIPQTFIIVGCGGTGSRLVPLLTQFLKTCPWVVEPAIFLIDDDVVEEKNLSRQNFIQQDVGKPKAEVLANRYGRAFNTPIMPIVSRVGGENSGRVYNQIFRNKETMIAGNIKSALVISCVDTMTARRAILDEFSQVWRSQGIFLDGGNEDVFGQVIICNPGQVMYRSPPTSDSDSLEKSLPQLHGMLPVRSNVNQIPIPIKFYWYGEEGASTRSCADLDQTMAINSLVAVTMFGLIQQIMFSKPINTPRMNISLSGTSPEYLTPQYLWSNSVNTSDYRGLDVTERYDRMFGSNAHHHAAEKGMTNYASCATLTPVADFCYQLHVEVDKFQREKKKKERAEAERVAREQERLRLEAEAEKERKRLEVEAQKAKEMEALVTPEEDAVVEATAVKRVKKKIPDNIPKLTPVPPTRLEIPEGFRV